MDDAFAARLGDLSGESVERLAPPRHEHKAHALRREQFGGGAANARACAGDDRRLAVEITHVELRSLLSKRTCAGRAILSGRERTSRQFCFGASARSP